MEAKAWETIITIPTYKTGEPEKNPMFLEKRVYQGSSGVVYPHPVIDKVYDEIEDKEYIALFLENEYLKIMILPQLGGRIQMAYDKTNDYHFVYYNRVIKPALVGLAGPWISGGIEFNWPQHHRPSTFEATDYLIKENDDGSKTVWVNEYEKMFGTKCALGFTLYKDRAYIELNAKLYNRTSFPQTFLWWANPAVHVDEHYQSVFPPDVHAVFDHGKRDVSSFPIAKGTYYKVDYSPGTDISVYTNIPVPTSYMAVNSKFNFLGGYHYKKQAGIMHVANHHISPGKKQWTWGCGDFGKAWDKQLTDNDGPYFELMCGVFTDNQPDFSWIMPNETRQFKQYFMPYKNIGHVKNASRDAMLNVEVVDGKTVVKLYATHKVIVDIFVHTSLTLFVLDNIEISPYKTFESEIHPDLNDTRLIRKIEVFNKEKKLLVDYKIHPVKKETLPEPAKPIGVPASICTNEELYLAGLHLEQYRHATYSPLDYYDEALRRDSSDARCNNAKGLWYLRRGQFEESEFYFRKAINKLVKHNPNPYDGEPFYNLGLCLKYQKKYDEAVENFYKSTWNAAMQDNAYLHLAYINAIQSNWQEVFELSLQSVYKNYNSLRARHLHALALRILGKVNDAIHFNQKTLKEDAFDFATMFEMYKCRLQMGDLKEAERNIIEIKKLVNERSYTYIEMAIQYADAGCYNEALEFLSLFARTATDPLTFYYLGYYESLRGNNNTSEEWLHKAIKCSPDKVFPNRIQDIMVLNFAIAHNPQDYKALYYLGNYYYAKRLYDKAGVCWERAIKINGYFATALRNLGIACYNKFNKEPEALQLFEKAFEADSKDSRILFELDQLYKKFNKPPEERLLLLKNHEGLIPDRDDLYMEYVSLHSLTGKWEEADTLLKARNFHPWEGGEGKAFGQHVQINVELAKHALQKNDWVKAEIFLQTAQQYPENLGEGKIYGAQENDIFYWLGRLYEKTGDTSKAQECWEKASTGLSEPAPALFYNDQQPDKILYQGFALLKLGKKQEAYQRFHNLIDYAKKHIEDEVKMDFFAVSLPDLMIFDDDLSRRNKIHCLYLFGLGNLGLCKKTKAKKYFDEVLTMDKAHSGAIIHSALLQKM